VETLASTVLAPVAFPVTGIKYDTNKRHELP